MKDKRCKVCEVPKSPDRFLMGKGGKLDRICLDCRSQYSLFTLKEACLLLRALGRRREVAQDKLGYIEGGLTVLNTPFKGNRWKI